MSPFDALVVGGGHNGLTCAAYLGRAGVRTLVLEHRDIVGGFCTTEETVPEAPGFKMNPTSADCVLTNVPPSVVDELDLPRYGLHWVRPDPFYSYLHPDGQRIRFWRDVSRTVDEIRTLSPRDAWRYDEFTHIMRDLWRTMAPYMMGHPTRVAPATLARVGRQALRSRRLLPRAIRILLSSPGAVIEEWFESPEVKAALACFSVSSMGSLDEPGTGVILSAMALQHEFGTARPVGGQGALTVALADAVRAHGGEIRTGTPVARVLTEGDRAVGVVTAGGEEIRASTVIASVDPTTLLTKLVPPELVPDRVRAELRGMSVLRNNISAFRADVALARRPQLARHREANDGLLGSVILFAPDIDYVRRSLTGSLRGELTDETPMWILTPTVHDRTLVPPGSSGDSLYLYMPAVPFDLGAQRRERCSARAGARAAPAAGAEDWESAKHKLYDRCMRVFEEFAPGVTDSVIGANVTSPPELVKYSPVHKGHPFHVDMSLNQFGPWRPTPSLSGYRTPVPGLWHTGAGAHPLGTINGWSGRSTAREVVRSMS